MHTFPLQVHGKSNFPYLLAASLSTSLWTKISPGVRVLVHLVHDHVHELDDRAFGEAVALLEEAGAHVNIVKASSGTGCVMTVRIPTNYFWCKVPLQYVSKGLFTQAMSKYTT